MVEPLGKLFHHFDPSASGSTVDVIDSSILIDFSVEIVLLLIRRR